MNHGGILVLGGGGFIGRHLLDSLALLGRPIVAATRTRTHGLPANVENVVCEFLQPEHFSPLLARCGTVIHAASVSTPGSTCAMPLAELDGNLRCTLALLTALQDHPNRQLIYLSSGGTLYGDHGESVVNEQTPLRPRSYHGAAKAAMEHFVHAWAAQYAGSAAILRPSNVYGPGQLPKRGFGIIPTAFEHALRSEPLPIWGDGGAIRDYLYVDDLTSLVRRLVERGIDPGTIIFNVSGEHGITLNSLLDHIDSVTGKPLRRQYQPGRTVDVRVIVPCAAAASTLLDWSPAVRLEDGLQRTWHWFTSRH